MNLLNSLVGSIVNVGSRVSIVTTAGITFTGEIIELRGPAPIPPGPALGPDYQIILLKITTAVSNYVVSQVIAIPVNQIVSIG